MAKPRPDRRVERTRQALRTALLDLILTQGYEAITVQDILDRANVGRSTFYAHFRDKDDLFMSGFEQLRALLAEHLGEQETDDETPWGVTLVFFQHARDHHQLYKALAGGQAGPAFMTQLQKMLTAQMRVHLRAVTGKHKLNLPQDVVAHHLVSSLLALLTWWLDHDLPYSAERINAIYRQLTEPGVRQAMGRA